MKVKFKLIPFAVAVIAMLALNLMSVFGLGDSGLLLGMNKITITYAEIGIALGLFVVCIIMNLFDRKTAPVYRVAKNPAAGVLSIIAGLAVIGSSVLALINSSANSEYYLMTVICALFSIPAGIALMLMCRAHFSGETTVSGLSALYIFPALWGCCELVSEFLGATKVSISSTDMTPLFCYIFLTLYLFSHATVVSRIKGRNPVKACFIYGLPSSALCLAYGVYIICTSFIESASMDQLLLGAQFAALSLYSLLFLVEMAFNSLTKDEVEIIDGIEDDEDTYEHSYIKNGGDYDSLVFAGNKADEKEEEEAFENLEVDGYKMPKSEVEDFVIGYNSDDYSDLINYQPKADDKSASSRSDTARRVEEKAEPISSDMARRVEEKPEPDSSDTARRAEEKPEPDSSDTARRVERKPEPVKSKREEQLSEIDRILRELDSKK